MTEDLDHTPADRRRQRVRDMILSAAERVLATSGADGLSIRGLAEKIDYSPAAIYKYFKSKDEIIDELKESFFAKLMAQVHSLHDETRPFAWRMRNAVATYVRIAVEKPHHYLAAFSGQISEDGPNEDDPEFGMSQKGAAFEMLKGLVQEGINSGHLRKDLDAALAAKSVWASMHGLAMMIAHVPIFPALKPNTETMPSGTFIELHADLVVRGLETLS